MANPDIATEQLLELLLTLKKTTPAAAKGILNGQPAIAYALMTLMVSMNAVNIEVFQNTLAEFGPAKAQEPSISTPMPHSSTPVPTSTTTQIMPQTAAPAPVSAIPPHIQAQYRTTTPPSYPGSNSFPPPSALASSSSSQAPTHTPTPPYAYGPANGQSSSASGFAYGQHGYGYQPPQSYQQQPPYQQHSQYQYQQYQQPPQSQPPPQAGYPGYPPYGAPTAASNTTPGLPDALAGISEEQKTLIMRVLAMTPEQINMLPPGDRATYIQIRTTLGVTT